MASEAKPRPAVPEVLESVASLARARGVAEYEAYAISERTRRVILERGALSGAETLSATGLHLRVCEDGRLGGAFCNSFAGPVVETCLSEAMKVSGLMQADTAWSGFPSCDSPCPKISGLLDRSVGSADLAAIGRMAEDMIQGALAVGRGISVTFGEIVATERMIGIVNSSGVNATMEDTAVAANCSCASGSGTSVTPDCYSVRMSRGLGLGVREIGEEAGWVAERSSRFLEGRTEECDVVFSPMSLGVDGSGLLSVILSQAFSGQNVARKVSFLADRVGDHVWSPRITIMDNPLVPGMCGSRPFDDEGVPSCRTSLVTKGRLDGFVWDSYHGAMSGEGSTGNAVRDASSGAVVAAPLCLQVAPGQGDLRSLIGQVDHGYLVWACQGAHTSDPETGSYSFVANPCLLIEKGEVVGGVRGAMVSGDVCDLLRSVDKVGSDVLDFGRTLMPSMSFTDVKVTTG